MMTFRNMKIFHHVFVGTVISVSMLLGQQVSGSFVDDVGEAPLVADKALIEKLNEQYKMDPGVLIRLEDLYPYECNVAEILFEAGLVPTQDWINDANPFKVLPRHFPTICKMSESQALYFWKHRVLFGRAWKKESYSNPTVSSSFINLEASSPYSENVSKDEYPGGRICMFSPGWLNHQCVSRTSTWGYIFDQEYALQRYVRCMYPADANTGIRTNGGCGRGIAAWVGKDYPKCIEEYRLKTDRGEVNYFTNFNDPARDLDGLIHGDDIQQMEDLFNEVSKNHTPSVHVWTPDYFNVGSCDQSPKPGLRPWKDASNWYNPFYKGAAFPVHVNGEGGDDRNAQWPIQESNNSEINAGIDAQKEFYSCSYYWRIWNLIQRPKGSTEITPEEYQQKQLWRLAFRSWRGLPIVNNFGYNDVVVHTPRVRNDIDGYMHKKIERNPIQAFFIVCNAPDYWGISARVIQEKFAETYALQVSVEEPRIPRVVYFDLHDAQTPFKAECPSSKELCSKVGGKFCTRLTGNPHEQEKDLVPAPPTTTTTTTTTTTINASRLGMILGTVAMILICLAVAMQLRRSRRTVIAPLELLG